MNAYHVQGPVPSARIKRCDSVAEKAMMMVPNEILGGKNALKKRGQKLCQRRVN